ncbi:MAG: chromosomal replication initiator protein DnaA [Candidatus Omnitrophota bacterium]|jgi:chromosomal replication initiator protein|nr:chromosomal replication initiator protein DnaA [Candidatus Omnitrophota bacterium]MDD5538884.1 chromosomal replication initiator protein DnaA [Candidatus Omnitrophota bacterium]
MTESNIWFQAAQAVRSKVGENAYEAWIKPIRPKSDSGKQTISLEVPNEFFREWLIQHYDLVIRDALKNAGCAFDVCYQINPALVEERPAPKPPPAPAASAREPMTPFLLNPKYTFDNFIVGPSNRFAHAACLSIADSPAKAYNPLFIYSRVGLGKTHLMQAICHRIRHNNPSTRFYYTTSEKFTTELIGAIQHRSTAAFREKFRNVDVLLIDDIHFIANKEATQEEFFHTFNALYDSHKQIIISSDRPPKEIQKLEERLVSRFSWGLVTDIQPPDLETRIAILKKKIENESVDIPDDVLHLIAEIIKSNIRELEGALVKVIAYSLLEEKHITLEMAKGVLKDLLKEASKQITVEDIQRAVADYFKIHPDELKTKKRVKNVVVPRQVAMYLSRELTSMSLPEIGLAFGGKDHTTVLHAFKKIQAEILKNHQIKSAVEQIKNDFQR